MKSHLQTIRTLLLSSKGCLLLSATPTAQYRVVGVMGTCSTDTCGHGKDFVAVPGYGLGMCFIQQKGCITLEQTGGAVKELRSLYA